MPPEILKREIVRLIEAYKALETQWNRASEIFGMDHESDFGRAIWSGITGWMDLLEYAITGSETDWLSWYIYENACGKKGYEATINGETRGIRTVDDLWWAMTCQTEETSA